MLVYMLSKQNHIYRVLTADKVKLNCYMLLRVSCISNHQTYIMFILPKKIKPKSFDTIKLQIQEIIILNKIDNPQCSVYTKVNWGSAPMNFCDGCPCKQKFNIILLQLRHIFCQFYTFLILLVFEISGIIYVPLFKSIS